MRSICVLIMYLLKASLFDIPVCCLRTVFTASSRLALADKQKAKSGCIKLTISTTFAYNLRDFNLLKKRCPVLIIMQND